MSVLPPESIPEEMWSESIEERMFHHLRNAVQRHATMIITMYILIRPFEVSSHFVHRGCDRDDLVSMPSISTPMNVAASLWPVQRAYKTSAIP